MQAAKKILSAEQSLQEKGWCVMPGLISKKLVDALNNDLATAYEEGRKLQQKAGIGDNMEGTAHHLLGRGSSFLELLVALEKNNDFMEHYFGGKYILNSYGAYINQPQKMAYTRNVHRDIRTFSGDMPFMLNLLVMLDEFTLENGATYLLSGTHKKEEKPSDEYFFQHAERATGPAGSLLWFNSNLWHAGGMNNTNKQRRALTLTFTKPFMKQQMDYPRVTGYEKRESLTPWLRQIIGYNARVPATLEEWYQPPEKRMYQPGQG